MVRKILTATRVIHADPPDVERGWAAQPSNEDRTVVPRALTAIEGMEHMQASRTDHVPASSLYQALLDKRRVLTNQALVYLPTLEFDTLGMDFFSDNAGDRRRACDSIGRNLTYSGAQNETCVSFHHACFTPLRNAFFFLIPVRLEQNWVTVFGAVRDKNANIVGHPNTFWDKVSWLFLIHCRSRFVNLRIR
jgi:hypothetical protein